MSCFKNKKHRLTFQHVKMSSLHCCVPKCTRDSRLNSEISFHTFPKDPEVRKQWLIKIRRYEFSPTPATRVCGKHFLSGDIEVGPGGKKRYLRKGAIPVLFEWNDTLPTPRLDQTDSHSDSDMVTLPCDHDYCATPKTAVMADEMRGEMFTALEEKDEEIRPLQHKAEALQLRTRCCLDRYAGSDEHIRLYTRFVSYKHLMAFWRLVESASASCSDFSLSTTKLPPIDELLLFLMYLSTGQSQIELAERFDIHRSTVSSIIATWTHFLYQLLGSQRLWMPREAVRAHLPPEFAGYQDTQVILDCTEIRIQAPSSLLLPSEVFSSYKSHPTLKAMIGMAPHGAVTFVSGLYAGSMSDKEIFRLSGITNLLTPDMAIMVDKGFLIENVAPCKVYRPAFCSRNAKMSREDVIKTQSIAHLRVHVERCIRRLKENKLFDTSIQLSVCGSIEELFSVACFLVNYQNGPLVKEWAT
ncbi:uncharacterized protein LOC125891117 isoform X1 [Epinephelus fuscoguttatus]|uniref:uncharacterized protein LOC125891117 isoform X1 n=1 Tax=Epinephelus fuscoguttatus TaxID=293821 RepID=UPI0020CFF676|nr:uncharacterized protein LOC125891117 isoform X1 [Epinephelus fuscoguttatus]